MANCGVVTTPPEQFVLAAEPQPIYVDTNVDGESPKAVRTSSPPKSVTHSAINLTGLLAVLVAVIALNGTSLDPVSLAVICMLSAALPIMAGDLLILKVHRNPAAGLLFSEDTGRLSWPLVIGSIDISRLAVKLTGFFGTLTTIGLLYSILPEYARDYYEPYWAFLFEYFPYFLVVAVPYFAVVDGLMLKPRDEYWHAGCFFVGNWSKIDPNAIKNHVLSWIIKGFFLPIMFVPLGKVAAVVVDYQWGSVFSSFVTFITWYIRLALVLDLTFATIGYVLTLRLFDYHIRSPNPYLLAWVAALACYTPFWTVIGDRYFGYRDDMNWWDWMQGYPGLAFVWGIALCSLHVVWVWQIVTFGCRFSNLTHRGILTNGPFRFTKHPSYVSKNLFWWMINVPFLSTAGVGEAMANCVLLLGVNTLYFIRARTEERHLSQDPTYVEYALWIEHHGIFRWAGRLLPVLRYRQPHRIPASPVSLNEQVDSPAGRV